jgi:carbamoyl-phosphate synthase small subunit
VRGMEKGYLVLETGDVFPGMLIGKIKESVGEVVFNTSMTGYQEIITDPSYAGQIITFSYPMIGNYGINSIDDESEKPPLSGVVIGDVCEEPSHFQVLQSFSEKLIELGVPGITGIDTRLLVKTIRSKGTVKGIISREKDYPKNKERAIFWVNQVSTKKPIHYPGNGPHVVLVDYGYKKSILHALLAQGCSVTVVPYYTTFNQIKAINPDGLFLSNGPGDPLELEPWFPEIKKMTQAYPTFGICLGHQLIALAYGAKTSKLAYGHRGANHPVKELLTGKVKMTSQNHGYVVVDESIDSRVFQVTYRNVNDKSIEGLKHVSLPIESVQFHPEAHAGPNDTVYLFEGFVKGLTSIGELRYAAT